MSILAYALGMGYASASKSAEQEYDAKRAHTDMHRTQMSMEKYLVPMTPEEQEHHSAYRLLQAHTEALEMNKRLGEIERLKDQAVSQIFQEIIQDFLDENPDFVKVFDKDRAWRVGMHNGDFVLEEVSSLIFSSKG